MLQQAIDSIKAKVVWRTRYDNFIGGEWVAPKGGEYFANISPITGKPVAEIARGQAADIELALDAAHRAKDAWGRKPAAERSLILNRIADRMEQNLEYPRARRDASTTASRSARRLRRTSRSPSTISAISPVASALRKGRSRKSITTPSPIISMSRSAWSGRSFRGISRS